MIRKLLSQSKLINSDCKKSRNFRFIVLFPMLFLFALSSYGQSPSNNCDYSDGGAELTVGSSCNFTTWDSTNGSDYWNSAAGCSATDRDDAWGWFTATATTTTITYSPDSRDAILTLFDATCATNMTRLACANAAGNAGDETIVYATTIGVDYAIRIQRNGSNNNMTGDICVYSPVPNDVCSGALSAPVNGSTTCTLSTTGGTVGATDNNETGDCTVGTENAIWYSFVATSTEHDVTVDGIAGFDAVIGALSTCGTTTTPTGGACTDATADDGIETMSLTGLTIGLTYYIQIYEYFGDQTANGFTLCITTPSPPCATPTAQPSALAFGTITQTTIAGSFTGAIPAPDNYLVVANTTGATPSPVDGTAYNIGDPVGAGNTVVDNDANNSFTATGLSDTTTYYFFVFSFNSVACTGGPAYYTVSPLTGNADTLAPVPCTTPSAQPTALSFGTITSGSIAATFTAAAPVPDNYLVVMNTTGTTPAPINTLTYNIGDPVGAGNTVVDNDSDVSFTAVSLSETTTYYFFIFSYNNLGCTGGPLYNTTSPLTDNATTIATAYCIPVTTNSNTYIDDFSTTGGITNITNNNTGYSVNGYGDYTAQIVSQTAGSAVNFSSAFEASPFSTVGANLWVDYNNDSDFDDLGEKVYASGGYVASISDSFIIPTATPAGSYRLRITIDYYTFNPDPCAFDADRGEFEDYTLVVGIPPSCSTPTAQATGLVFGSVTSSSIGGSFTAAAPIPDNYLVVMNTTGAVPSPVDSIFYNIGDTVGAGNTVVDNDNDTSFSAAGLSPTTTYYFFIFTYNNLACSGGPAYYNTVGPLTGNETTAAVSAYCTPIVTGGATAAAPVQEAALYIDDIEFIGTLNDVTNLNNGYSSSAPVGYQDHTGLPNSIQAQGEGINISVDSGTARGHMKAWVDWDSNGVFDNVAENVYDTGGVATSATTFGFVIPATQPIGEYRIRIKFYTSYDWWGGTEFPYYDSNPCENIDTYSTNYERGETEDYTFTVIQSCGATIDAITEGFNCGDGTVNLVATGSPGTVQYNWYANEADLVPLATTASGNWITPPLTTTTDFWVTADNGSCESLVKTKMTAKINPITTLSFTPSVPEVCGEGDIIEITASGANEVAHLIDEDFEGAGLGSFTNNNIRSYTAGETAITNWQQRTSTFVPSEAVWFPAISSGFGTNQFAMATSDSSTTNITENALESATLDTSTFTDLTLNFDYYFSRYFPSIPENVNVEVSTNGGGAWTTVQSITVDSGYGTAFTSASYDLSAYVDETNFKVRIRYYADYWCDGVAVDNIELFGTRPMTSSFTWTSASPIDAYTDPGTTIPYIPGNTVTTVYVRPTIVQLKQPTFNFVATATLTNGCNVSINIDIDNKTQYWTGVTSTDWNDPTNWLPTGVPTPDNCVIIPDQTIISGTGYDAFARNLTVQAAGDLLLESENNLTVTEWVVVDAGGEFLMQNAASLVQVDNVANSGIVKMERDTQPIYRHDYTYWASPMTTASSFKLLSLSPDTPNDKFYGWTPTLAGGNGNWAIQPGATTDMVTGQGYAIRGPQTFSDNPVTQVVYSGTFEGTPANGDLSVPISVGTDANIGFMYGDTAVTADDDQWNLIGNPYASAIDVTSFLNDPANTAILDGTVYVWTHNTPPSAANPDPFYGDYSSNYTSNDYASINSLGTTATAATGGQVPTSFINSGQGFFVLGLANGNAVWDNSMRVTNDNNNFFKTSGGASKTPVPDFEKHRVWLNLSNEHGAFSQTLVGYAQGASLGFDRALDGKSFGGNDVTFYSVIPTDNFKIQARPLPFNDTDVVPLGYKATVQNSYRIGLDHLDGLFEDQNIYLRDKDLDIIHDLKVSPYIFDSEVGVFDERFELIYKNGLLTVEETTKDNKSLKVISGDNLVVISGTQTIQSIVVHDVLGRTLQSYDTIDKQRFQLNGIEKGNRMLLLQITLDDNTVIIKKPIF